jgi:hypothetical protein
LQAYSIGGTFQVIQNQQIKQNKKYGHEKCGLTKLRQKINRRNEYAYLFGMDGASSTHTLHASLPLPTPEIIQANDQC